MAKGTAAQQGLSRALGIDTVVEFQNGRPAHKRRVTCSSCGAIQIIAVKPNAPSDWVRQLFASKGWDGFGHNGRRLTCPSCNQRRPQIMNNKAPVSAGSAKAAAAAGAAIPVEGSPRPPASVDKARIRVFLDGNFDDSRGAYLDGLDDKKAAEKLGVPWKWVTDIREAAYGPIRSNPEVDALKRDVAALRHQAEAMLAEIAKLEGRLAQIAS